MAGRPPEPPRTAQIDRAERLLDQRGHRVANTRFRVAAGRSGLVVGFPREPMIHVAWWFLAAGAVLFGVLRRRGR